MTQIADYRKNGSDDLFVAYDFDKVDQVFICDEISRDCEYLILASKVVAVAIVVISLAPLFFTTIGVISFVLPSGILGTAVSLWTLAELATLSLLADFAPVCFLSNALQSLLVMNEHYQGQIALAENRKIEILTGRHSA